MIELETIRLGVVIASYAILVGWNVVSLAALALTYYNRRYARREVATLDARRTTYEQERIIAYDDLKTKSALFWGQFVFAFVGVLAFIGSPFPEIDIAKDVQTWQDISNLLLYRSLLFTGQFFMFRSALAKRLGQRNFDASMRSIRPILDAAHHNSQKLEAIEKKVDLMSRGMDAPEDGVGYPREQV